MKASLTLVLFLVTIAAFASCEQQAAKLEAEPLTYQRGAQLLAAGSPKSAIPYLAQTTVAAPDGPEPLALLALAYALDLQDQRAIQQAQLVHRPAGSPAGWELVAVAIAEMTRHHPQQAITQLNRQITGDYSDSPIAPAARQWLAMAHVLAADHDKALSTLNLLAKNDSMRSTSLLWTAIIHLQHGRTADATAALSQCAKLAETPSGRIALQSNLANADDQTLYDAGISAVAANDLDMANGLFTRVHDHNADASDTAVWMALIAGIKHDWQTGRSLLKTATERGAAQPRGLANQLFSIVCALEDRPDTMIEYMLAGQRMLGRNSVPAYVHDHPKADNVWGSDLIK